MPEIYRWNTGAQYTRHGQRIQAEVNDNNKVFFMDWDRGIQGETEEEVPWEWGTWSSASRIHWIHNEYLHNRYRMACEPGMWPDGRDATYPLVRR